MTDNKKEIIIPGEKIGTVEEFIPGKGTYEEDGNVYSMAMGELTIDSEAMEARIKRAKVPAEIHKNNLVIARVTRIRGSMVVADVVRIVGKDREVAGETMASLHVSKISKDYVEDVGRMYRIGDYIRAKVFQAKPSIQITTAEPELGVLRSLCMKCRKPMNYLGKKGTLKCNECSRIETRKVSKDYAKLNLDKL